MRKSRLSHAMDAKAREAREHAEFLRDLPDLVRHEVREGCRMDEMLRRGELPTQESLERSIFESIERSKT